MAQQMKNIHTVKEERKVSVKLTDPELINYGRQIGEERIALNRENADFLNRKELNKGEVAKHEREISRLVDALHSGTEMRNVQCEKVMDLDTNIVQVRYKGEIIEERTIKDSERQLVMPLRAVGAISGVGSEAVDPQVAAAMREETSHRTKRDASQG